MARVYIELSCPAFQQSARLEIQLYDHRFSRAVANFLYLLSAHEIPNEVLRQREQAIGSPLPPPLRGTPLLRISPDRKQVDFGGSPSASVYGGCYDDDVDLTAVRAAIQQQQQQGQANKKKQPVVNNNNNSSNPFATATDSNNNNNVNGDGGNPFAIFEHGRGTISVSNCGPNTNGSRYFFSTERRPELDGLHQVIGVVAPHSFEVLQIIALTHKVSAKKGNAPDPAIVVSDCGIIRAHESWKQLALAPPTAAPAAKQSRLLQRGQDRGKRPESVTEAQALAGTGLAIAAGGEAAAELGELARRNAKRRRIESAASGEGAWQEPEELLLAEASAASGGTISSAHHRAEWESSGAAAREKKRLDAESKQNAAGLSRRERWAQDASAARPQQALTERNIFAMAARTSQFEQDLKEVAEVHKIRGKKHEQKGRKLRY